MKRITLQMSDIEYGNLKRVIEQQKNFAVKAIRQSGDTAQGESTRMAAQHAIDMCDGLLLQMELQEIAEEDSAPHALDFAHRAKTGEDIEEVAGNAIRARKRKQAAPNPFEDD